MCQKKKEVSCNLIFYRFSEKSFFLTSSDRFSTTGGSFVLPQFFPSFKLDVFTLFTINCWLTTRFVTNWDAFSNIFGVLWLYYSFEKPSFHPKLRSWISFDNCPQSPPSRLQDYSTYNKGIMVWTFNYFFCIALSQMNGAWKIVSPQWGF